MKFTSSKLAPFRKFSVGYTGQSKFALRDWKFSLEEIKQVTKFALILYLYVIINRELQI